MQTESFNNKTAYFHIDEDNNHWLNANIRMSVNNNGDIQSFLISQTTLESNRIANIAKGDNGNLYFIGSSVNNISVLAPDGNWSFLPTPPICDTF